MFSYNHLVDSKEIKNLKNTELKQPKTFSLTEDDFLSMPYTLYRYEPAQINKILHEWLEDEKEKSLVIQDTFTHVKKPQETAGWILSNKKGQKTALFKVAHIPSTCNEEEVQGSPLETALHSFQAKNIHCDKLIIPLEDMSRNHFRLLVIKPTEKIAIFYDSKSKLLAQTIDIYTSALSAFYSTHTKFFYKLPSAFMEKYYYVENVCKKYFSDIQFKESFLGHQFNEHPDSTPFLVEYAIHETLGKLELKDLKLEVKKMREKHSDLFYKKMNMKTSPPHYFFKNKPLEKNHHDSKFCQYPSYIL